MRLAFIGCVQFSHAVLSHLAPMFRNGVELVGVVTRRASRFNSDFVSLEGLASDFGAPCFLAEGNDQAAMVSWLTELRPDVIYCFGWSYLLSPAVLALPPLGVIGYHPATLPANRGRHPIIWALALGLTETASTFFVMDEGADSGDIVSQEAVPISSEDYAQDLYLKLVGVGSSQAMALTRELLEGVAVRRPQDHSGANYWRKRGVADGQVDWRMGARQLYNLVRALSRPYVGAQLLLAGQEIKIWRAVPVAEAPVNLEPGKVLAVEGHKVLVKCGEGALWLIEHELTTLPEVGGYL